MPIRIDQLSGGIDKYGERTVREVADLVGKKLDRYDGERLRAAGAIAQQMREVGHLAGPLANEGAQFEPLGRPLLIRGSTTRNGMTRAQVPAAREAKQILSDARLFHWRMGDGQIGIDEEWTLMRPKPGSLLERQGPLNPRNFELPLVHETTGKELGEFALPQGPSKGKIVQRVFWGPPGTSSEHLPNWAIRLAAPKDRTEDTLKDATERLIHEMSHALDGRYEELDEGALDFLRGRAAGRPDVDLHLKAPEYGAGMIDVINDELITPYSGRVYPLVSGKRHGSGTEAFSTGAQNLYKHGLDFYLNDKHHFLFTLGTLR